MVARSKVSNKKKEHHLGANYAAKLLKQLNLKIQSYKKARIKGKVTLPPTSFINLTKFFAPIFAKKKNKSESRPRNRLAGRVTA